MDADEYEEEEEAEEEEEIFVHYCHLLSCFIGLPFCETKTVRKATEIMIGCVNKTEGEEVYECENGSEGVEEAGDEAPLLKLLCFGNLLCQCLLLINGKQST